MKNNKGFTLVELLAVIVIMGILMMVAIPSVTRTIENSRKDTFVDIAKSYANAARNMWTTDNLTCNGVVSSAVDDGDYYILINSKSGAKETLPTLVDQGGKSSWGNRDVNGYVRVNINTTPGEDTNNDGTYEVEPRRITKFYVALSDGTHGLVDDDTLTTDELKRGNVVMTLSQEQLKKIQLTIEDGKLNCAKTNFGTFICTDVTPVTNISGICIDDQTTVATVGQIEITPTNFASDDWTTVIAALKSGNHPYHVGDTKAVNMGSLGNHTIRLSNLTPCDGSLESQTACGVVLEFADAFRSTTMNPSGEYKGINYPYGFNVDGWPATKAYNYLKNDVYNSLPSELQSAIITTKVVSGHGSTAGETDFVSYDKLYLLSAAEVYQKETSDMVKNYDTANGSTRQLDYYTGTATGNFAKAIKKHGSSDTAWWLRSAYSTSNYNFFSVSYNGGHMYYTANSSCSLSPAFRIA